MLLSLSKQEYESLAMSCILFSYFDQYPLKFVEFQIEVAISAGNHCARAPRKRQVIFWANDSAVRRRIYAPPSLNVFNVYSGIAEWFWH